MPSTELVETRFLYREMVQEAQERQDWSSRGIQMLPSDPSFSTAQNCAIMCCQKPSFDQSELRVQAREAHERIVKMS